MLFQASWFSPYKGKVKHICFTRQRPKQTWPRLGPNLDEDGNVWTVNALIGKWVCAVKGDPYREMDTSTWGGSYGMRSYPPCTWEMVDALEGGTP